MAILRNATQLVFLCSNVALFCKSRQFRRNKRLWIVCSFNHISRADVNASRCISLQPRDRSLPLLCFSVVPSLLVTHQLLVLVGSRFTIHSLESESSAFWISTVGSSNILTSLCFFHWFPPYFSFFFVLTLPMQCLSYESESQNRKPIAYF
jgi:hypothetical protein